MPLTKMVESTLGAVVWPFTIGKPIWDITEREVFRPIGKGIKRAFTPPTPKMPKPLSPAPTPRVTTVGTATEQERLRRARASSGTLLSRGLLAERPEIYYPKLGGTNTLLGT